MKIYKIRSKVTGQFVNVGYNSKNSWKVYPSAVINNNLSLLNHKEDYEIVVFEYELKETKTIELK